MESTIVAPQVDIETAADQLTEPGWGVIPLASGKILPAVIAGFDQFLAEPVEYKALWQFDLLGDGDPDDGYIRRGGDQQDDKAFFHFRPVLYQALDSRTGLDWRRYEGWLKDVFALYTLCYDALDRLTKALDQQIDGHQFNQQIRLAESRRLSVLRLVYYEPPSPGRPVIGRRHTDRDFITIHVAESFSGLLLGSETTPQEIQPNQALVFPGQKAAYMTDSLLPAVSHEVIAPFCPETEDGLTAIIFFGHTATPVGP